jgi:hypothetical protein
MISSLTLFESFIDILLSFDRIVLFTDRFKFYKKLKPTLLCLVLFVVSYVLMMHWWLLYRYDQFKIQLSEKEEYLLSFMNRSSLYRQNLVHVTNAISDLLPLCCEIPLNIITIVLLRAYLNKKKKILASTTSTNLNQTNFTISNNNENTDKTAARKTKRMEVKVTSLVIFMSFISTL